LRMSELRFDGKVALITGAGSGLGRSYALLLAARGAKVLVNDNGCNVSGEGSAVNSANLVVEQIKKAGGTAVANHDSADQGEKIVKACVDAFGTVDIVINNAGILRDISFQKMTEQDWDKIMKTHLYGSFSVARAAWNILREKSYGRIVNTGSSAGLYGSFGQVNYSTAKMGMHGFTQSLAKEGEKRNIFVNTICPLAGTRMTETVLPKDLSVALKPDYVAPLVAYLVHDSCQETGSLFEVGAGFVAKMRWQRSKGILVPVKQFTPEAVAAKFAQAIDFEKEATFPESNQEMNEIIMTNITPGEEPAPQEAPKSDLKSDEIFGMMASYLAKGEGKALIPQLSAIYGFQITKTKGGKVEATYEIDLKNKQGAVVKGVPASADATFTMTDDDFHQVCMGKLNPQIAFMQGKMKIKGNMSKATKFTPQLFPPPTPENLAKYPSHKL